MTDKAKDKTSKATHKTTQKPLEATGVVLASTISSNNSLGKSIRLYEANQASFAKLIDLDRPLLQIAKSMQALDSFKFPAQQMITAMESIQSAYGITETAQRSLARQMELIPKLHDMLGLETTLSSFGGIAKLANSYQSIINSMVDISSLQSFTRLNSYTTRNIGLESITLEQDQIEATSVSNTEISVGILKLTHTQTVSMSARLERVEMTSQELRESQQEILTKLDRLDSIEKLILEGNAKFIPARIQSFNLTENGSKLTINNQGIALDPNSKQAFLAQLFFSSPEAITKRWHIEDIIDEYDSQATTEDIKSWDNKFYHSVRSLNSKIGMVLGTTSQVVKYQRQEYWINPDLLNLFDL